MYLDRLRALCISIAPNLRAVIEHDSLVTASTWNTVGETGKAVELYSLCSLSSAFSSMGITTHLPNLYNDKPDLFYLRNILPRHHGAQAGHAAAINSIPLVDRFVAALTPKLVFENAGLQYSIFREGLPFHLIEHANQGNAEYLDRPDVIISEGASACKILSAEKIEFSYRCESGQCNGILRIKNDAGLPIISYDTTLKENIPVMGIIECSVSKGDIRAEEQLKRYLSLLGKSRAPVSLLINGRQKKCPAYDFEAYIDMGFEKPDPIADLSVTMRAFAEAVIKSL